MKWTTFKTKILRGTIKVDLKKDVYHLALVINTLM
jgi:hypothetical protein